jgi:phospholipase/carboxylesterase
VDEPRRVPAPAGGTPYRYRQRKDAQGPAVMMLHGWGGDEDAMWILETTLPLLPLLVSLRGTDPLPAGGFAWGAEQGGLDTSFEDFHSTFDVIISVRQDIEAKLPRAPNRWLLMGFSQGAAVSFSLAADGSMLPDGIIALAGYLPHGDLAPLQDVPIYWGHGTRDDFVPILRAEKDVQRLREVNDSVEFCQTDVGHKLGVECARGLKGWFRHYFPETSSQDQRAW